jgi:hypothetical protein
MAVISIARTFPLVTLSLCLVAIGAPRVWAQDPATPAPAASAAPSSPASVQDDDDDAVLDPAEPDYTVINLPTTMVLPKHKSNFRLTHRFNGNLRNGTFGQNAGNLFGLDQGATIGFEYRFAPVRHVEAAAYRSSFDKTIQLYGKYDAIRQHDSMPMSVSALVSVEGTNNFQENYAPAIGLVVSRLVAGRFAAYATPIWVHNTAASLDRDENTFLLGLGGRARIHHTTYVVAEVTPRLSGYAPDQVEYGFGLEERVGGHTFVLTFTNTFASTFGQLARGGPADALYLGFNLGRKFF